MFLKKLLFNSLYTFSPNPLKHLLVNIRCGGLLLKRCNTNSSVNKFCTTSSGTPHLSEKDKKHKPFRHEYPDELEGAVNNQILAEFNASIVYLSMSCYYGRTDVALPGSQSFFCMMFKEEQRHATEFINYQLKRGGEVKLFPITSPENSEWTDITVALGVALELEKRIKEKLECLYTTAEHYTDIELMDLLSTKFIVEQNESIWEIGRLLTRGKRLADTGGVGRHLFDQAIYSYVEKKSPKDLVPYYM